jgi:hypothetical protein
MSLLKGPPGSTGGRQSTLVDELGVNPSRYRHDEQKVRRGRSSETSVSPHHSQSTNILTVCGWCYRTSLLSGSFVFARFRVQILVPRPAILTKDFRDFSQSLQANVRILPKIMPRRPPSTSFTIHHSPILLQSTLYSLCYWESVAK